MSPRARIALGVAAAVVAAAGIARAPCQATMLA